MRKRLRLEQAFACDEDWDAMPGDSKRRHCAECDRTLVNLSKLTEIEAYAFAQKELKTDHFCCVFEIEDDRIRFESAPTRIPNLVRVAALSLPLLAACESPGSSANTEEVVQAIGAEPLLKEVDDSKGQEAEVAAAALHRSESDASATPDTVTVEDMAEREARADSAKSLYFEIFVEDGHAKPIGDIEIIQRHRDLDSRRHHKPKVSMGIFIEANR